MSDVNHAPGRTKIDCPSAAQDTGGAHESPASPLRSPEAFEAYCLRVQAQLNNRGARRRQFLQEAYDRLTAMLRAARAVEDAALVQEIREHRQTILQILGAPDSSDQDHFRPADDSAGISETTVCSDARREQPRTSQVTFANARPELPGAYAHPEQDTVGRVPRRAVRPLNDIESDAAALRTELEAASARWSLRDSGGALIPANCLRFRAIACRCRRLETEAGDTEVPEIAAITRDIRAILKAGDDTVYTVPLDYGLEQAPTAYQWGEMAERYAEMAQAQEAFDWWRTESRLILSDIQPLAEAVAAIQQRFNRLLFRLGARDPFQQQLFDDLRVWAREAQCYLHSLRPKVPIAELVDRAATIEAAWHGARHALDGDQ